MEKKKERQKEIIQERGKYTHKEKMNFYNEKLKKDFLGEHGTI